MSNNTSIIYENNEGIDKEILIQVWEWDVI